MHVATPPAPRNELPPSILIPLPLISFQPILDRNPVEPRLAKNLLALPLPEWLIGEDSHLYT